ncbi:uncharacterized protein LOC105218309 [Zeugodacus cucurbitae]|uniref:uncharacterized protein LOC105218309 n=1 Tax=Zeugodacus cucurbitae TaxID=28588 RepID=UPI0023D93AEB|nr:uncharacterized protein LOC105218309 [Zeugodacus cucurbitae]
MREMHSARLQRVAKFPTHILSHNFKNFRQIKMLKLNISDSFLLLCIVAFQSIYAKNGSTKDNHQPQSAGHVTTPSPEWLEYQRERFSNAKDVETLRKMLDPASKLLETKKVQTDDLTAIPRIHSTREQGAPKLEKENVYNEATVEEVPNEPKHKDEMDDVENTDESNEMRSKAENTNVLSHVIKGIQYPTLRGFINFLKTVQRRWVKQSKLTFEQKLNTLKNLKNKMMHLIEDQFSMIWTPKVHMRRRRGLLEESNLNFPPEAALISINFLTFAVFLIKLVMQVVHIIKSKHYTLSGFGFTSAGTMTKST